MESLTKQQMILLALLVSFVTSIATGIVTVSLMDQAPQSVTQTINRVVERTVERVVPASVTANANSANKDQIITKETVVVKDDDVVVAAVEKNRPSVFKVMKIRNEYGISKERFGGLAVPVTDKGMLVSDIAVLQKKYDDYGTIIPESYKAVAADGKSWTIIPIGADEKNDLVFFEVMTAENKPDTTAFGGVHVNLADSNKLKLGQAVVALGGAEESTVSTGIISALMQNKDQSGKGAYSAINTDIQFDGAVSGTLLINLSGDVAGILVGKIGQGASYLPSNVISEGMQRFATSTSSVTL